MGDSEGDQSCLSRSSLVLVAISTTLFMPACAVDVDSSKTTTSTASTDLSKAAIGSLEKASGIPSLPLDSYRLTKNDNAVFSRSQAVLAEECMRRFGFESSLPKASISAGVDAEEAEARSRLYGITSLDRAQKFGYGLEPASSPARPDPLPAAPNQMFVLLGLRPNENPPEGEPKASPGKVAGKEVPPGGCRGEAGKELFRSSSVDAPYQLAGQLAISSWMESKSDKRVTDAQSRWSACMKTRGYIYSDLLKVAEKFPRDYDATKPSTAELESAVADVKCKQQTDLVATWSKVNAEYETKAIERNQLALTEERRRIDEALKKCTDIISRE